MEVAIPLIGLLGLYVMRNNSTKKSQEGYRSRNPARRLPNMHTRSINYPVQKKNAEMNDVNYYAGGKKSGADKMFEKLRVLSKTGDVVEAISSKGELKEERKNERRQDKSFLSLTGEKIGEKGFRHNNMQPFFGSSVKQRIGDYATAETLLDNMQGAGNTTVSKESMAPLFKPQAKMHWVNGMPNMNDFIQSRVNPSRKVSGVKPWESVRVGPGLNQKEGFKGSGGFNSGMEARDRWIAKSVDELRIATNPKVTYQGVMLGGGTRAGLCERGKQGKVEKNRPDTFYINGPDRWFTTNSAAGESSTSRSIQPDRAVNRPGTSREYFGAGQESALGEIVQGKYEQPKKPVYTKAPNPGPADGLTGTWKAGGPEANKDDFGKNSYKNRMNARALTNNDEYYGGAASLVNAIVAPVMDILRPSRKENAVGTLRPTGNAHSTVSNMPVFDPNDTLKTTNKETTIDNPNFGGMPNIESGDGYLANIANGYESAPGQNRDSTNCEYISNAGSALNAKARLYNAEYNMTLNADKQILTQGRAPNGNMNLYNPYTNVKIDKLDSDRFNGRATFSNNSSVTSIPSTELMGKVAQRVPLGMGQGCARNSPEVLDAFRCNPYTQSLASVR